MNTVTLVVLLTPGLMVNSGSGAMLEAEIGADRLPGGLFPAGM